MPSILPVRQMNRSHHRIHGSHEDPGPTSPTRLHNFRRPNICQGYPRIPSSRDLGSLQASSSNRTSTQSPSESWAHRICKPSFCKRNESGSKWSRQSLPLQLLLMPNTEKRYLDKTEEQIYKQQKMAGQVLITNNKSWTMPTKSSPSQGKTHGQSSLPS